MYINDVIGIHKYDINGNLIHSWPFKYGESESEGKSSTSNFCFLNGECFVTQWSNHTISVFK